MRNEGSSRRRRGSWRPSNKGATVKSRWAFRISREANGKLKFRARIVAKGYTEKYGVDYLETFAPTVATKSLMAVLHIAAAQDWEIRTLDVSNAYLEAPAPNDHLFMELPPSERDPSGCRVVVRLLKTLYGLKEAGFEWNRRVDGILRSGGWTPVRVLEGRRQWDRDSLRTTSSTWARTSC